MTKSSRSSTAWSGAATSIVSARRLEPRGEVRGKSKAAASRSQVLAAATTAARRTVKPFSTSRQSAPRTRRNQSYASGPGDKAWRGNDEEPHGCRAHAQRAFSPLRPRAISRRVEYHVGKSSTDTRDSATKTASREVRTARRQTLFAASAAPAERFEKNSRTADAVVVPVIIQSHVFSLGARGFQDRSPSFEATGKLDKTTSTSAKPRRAY